MESVNAQITDAVTQTNVKQIAVNPAQEINEVTNQITEDTGNQEEQEKSNS